MNVLLLITVTLPGHSNSAVARTTSSQIPEFSYFNAVKGSGRFGSVPNETNACELPTAQFGGVEI